MKLLGLCLSTLMATGTPAAPPDGEPVFLPITTLTLAWTHSIEKVRWEEDYQVFVRDGLLWLEATEARVKGSAAGMEPPQDARWVQGWFAYTPTLRHLPQLRLSRSEYAADYELCAQGRCQPLTTWLGARQGYALVQPCTKPAVHAPNPGITPPPAPGSSG